MYKRRTPFHAVQNSIKIFNLYLDVGYSPVHHTYSRKEPNFLEEEGELMFATAN